MTHIQVGRVTAVTWKPDESRQFENANACFICLTFKRKVTFVSEKKGYVWMVPSNILLPECDACEGKLTVEIQFPYTLYLRQISTQELDYYFGIKPDYMRGDYMSNIKRKKPEFSQWAPKRTRKKDSKV